MALVSMTSSIQARAIPTQIICVVLVRPVAALVTTFLRPAPRRQTSGALPVLAATVITTMGYSVALV